MKRMSRLIPWIALTTTLLAAGLLVDNLRLRAENDDLQALQAQVSPPPPVPTVAATPEGLRRIDSTPTSRESSALEDEVENRMEEEIDARVEARVDERIEERHSERREQHRERMRTSVEDFVADAGLSAEIETRMLTVMDDAMTSLGETFRAVHNGEMEREDVRPEMQGIREDMEDALVEILGEENTQAFQEGLQGPLGRH